MVQFIVKLTEEEQARLRYFAQGWPGGMAGFLRDKAGLTSRGGGR